MIREAFIPENVKSGFMFKLWNNMVSPFHRNVLEHRHLQFEIVLFKSGNGRYTTKSGSHDIKKGDIFVFASNEQHCITDVFDGEAFEFINIHFEPRYVWGSRNNGLSNDAIGYIIPDNDFSMMFLGTGKVMKKLFGNHYLEIFSFGKNTAVNIADKFKEICDEVKKVD